MITADEARGLDPKQAVETDLETLDRMIRSAAALGRKSIRAPHDMTQHKGYSQSFKREGVREALIEAGYTVTDRSEERQFVDLWIEISWEPTDG
jgi:hypothetical protein